MFLDKAESLGRILHLPPQKKLTALFCPQPTGILNSSINFEGTSRASSQQVSLVDLSQLAEAVLCYIDSIILISICAVYKTAHKFFCLRCGVLSPYPFKEEMLCCYVAL